MLAKKSFFVNRSHQTKVGFCLSDVVAMMSGIIQGGGIGPVMFIIYIDDLAKLLEQMVSQPSFLPMMSKFIWK